MKTEHGKIISNSQKIKFLKVLEFFTGLVDDIKNLLKISFIYNYISYAIIAWTISFKTNLQGFLKKQKKKCCTNNFSYKQA